MALQACLDKVGPLSGLTQLIKGVLTTSLSQLLTVFACVTVKRPVLCKTRQSMFPDLIGLSCSYKIGKINLFWGWRIDNNGLLLVTLLTKTNTHDCHNCDMQNSANIKMNHTQRNDSRTLITISECWHHYSSVACINAEKNWCHSSANSNRCNHFLLCPVFTANPMLRRRMEFRSRYSVQCDLIRTQSLSSLLSTAAISGDLFKPVCKAGIII